MKERTIIDLEGEIIPTQERLQELQNKGIKYRRGATIFSSISQAPQQDGTITQTYVPKEYCHG